MTTVLLMCANVAQFLFRCFVLLKLWQWFAVPLGAVHIEYAHAVGIRAFMVAATYTAQPVWASLLRAERDVNEDTKTAARVGAPLAGFYVSGLTLTAGWLAHLALT